MFWDENVILVSACVGLFRRSVVGSPLSVDNELFGCGAMISLGRNRADNVPIIGYIAVRHSEDFIQILKKKT